MVVATFRDATGRGSPALFMGSAGVAADFSPPNEERTMSRLNRFIGAALACCLAAGGTTFAHAAPLPPDRAPAPQTYRARSVLGSKVNIQGNQGIGTVDDIVFDEDGYIDYVIVANEGKYVTVPWEAAKFDYEKRTAVIEITQDRYKEIPTFTSETWPNVYEPAYREKVYTYYGVKPRREIRVRRP
jgi:PRC-barrel domain